MAVRPRKNPCASCPYRQDCPSGVWDESEYGKLPDYDGDTAEQAMRGAHGVFMCHQGNGDVCAGWAAVSGDEDSFALRLARSLDREIDVEAVLDYTTDVPLWSSGAEAAAHGKRDLVTPGDKAREAVTKIARVRSVRGSPVKIGLEEEK